MNANWPTVDGPVQGALLVAPPEVEDKCVDGGRLARFAPVMRTAFPFPSIVAASRNDPYIRHSRASGWRGCGRAGSSMPAGSDTSMPSPDIHNWPFGQFLLRQPANRRSNPSRRAPAPGRELRGAAARARAIALGRILVKQTLSGRGRGGPCSFSRAGVQPGDDRPRRRGYPATQGETGLDLGDPDLSRLRRPRSPTAPKSSRGWAGARPAHWAYRSR